MAARPEVVSYGEAICMDALARWRKKEKLSKEVLEAITTANIEQVNALLEDWKTHPVTSRALADSFLAPSSSREYAFRTPLMAAAARGNTHIFRAVWSIVHLCIEGLEIKEALWKKQLMSQDQFGKTLLMLAATGLDILNDVLGLICEFQVPERLLDQDYGSNTVLMHTVSSVSYSFVMLSSVLRAIEFNYSRHKVEEQLLARCNDGSTILIKAAKEGDGIYLSAVVKTFERIVHPRKVRRLARHCDREGMTLLMHAASCCKKEQAGAQGQRGNQESARKSSRPPSAYVGDHGKHRAFPHLLSDQDGQRDWLGVFKMAISFVKATLSKEQVRKLLQAEDSWGKTVLEHAFHSGNEQVFSVVLASVREEIGDFKTGMILNTSVAGARVGSTAKHRSFCRRISELQSSPILHDALRTYVARLEAFIPGKLIAIFLLAVPDSADHTRGALDLLIALTVVAPLLYSVVNLVGTQELASTRRSVMTFLLFAPAMFCWGLGTTSIGQDAFGLSKSASVALPLLATISIPALDSLLSHLLQRALWRAHRPTERGPGGPTTGPTTGPSTGPSTGGAQSPVQGQIPSNAQDTDCRALWRDRRPTERTPEGLTTGGAQSPVQGQIPSNAQDTDCVSRKKRALWRARRPTERALEGPTTGGAQSPVQGGPTTGGAQSPVQGQIPSNAQDTDCRASWKARRPTVRAPEGLATGGAQSPVQWQIPSNAQDTDSDGEEKRKEPHPFGAPVSSNSDTGSEVSSSVKQVSAAPAEITDAQSSGTYAIGIEGVGGDDSAASSGKGTVVAQALGGQTLPASKWGDFSVRGKTGDVSSSGDTVVFDIMRDAFGFVEVKIAHQESALMNSVKLVDRVYTEQISVRGELETYFIDPVVEGPHGVEFSQASIRYFLGRYDGLLVKFDHNNKGTPDKDHLKGEIGSLAVQEYFPMHKPHSQEGTSELPWQAEGEFTPVWDGDELWLEAPLAHFSPRGRGWISRRRKTPPLSPTRGVEKWMESGPIQAAEDVVSARLIRLVNKTQQTVRICITPDANPAEQATKKKAIGGGFKAWMFGADAHHNKDASHQHGAMGWASNAPLRVQHNPLPSGQSYKNPLGGKGDGGVIWYTVHKLYPSDLASGKSQHAQPQPGRTPPAQETAQSGHTVPAQPQRKPEQPLVCGFNLARLRVEYGYVVDQARGEFVKRRKPSIPDNDHGETEGFEWLTIVRIRHDGRISPGWYSQMNQGALTEETVKDFVLRPGQDDVNGTINQYNRENVLLYKR